MYQQNGMNIFNYILSTTFKFANPWFTWWLIIYVRLIILNMKASYRKQFFLGVNFTLKDNFLYN